MGYQQHIDEIARAAVNTDGADLPALVALQSLVKALQEAADADRATDVAEGAAAVITIIDDIVLRNIEDADAGFQLLIEAIETVQTIVESAGADCSATQSSTEDMADSSAVPADCDEELLNAWLSSCETAVSELEALVLLIEAGEADTDDGNALAELRRILHTIKGECGVLAKHEAQALFHEAETCIDLFTGGEIDLPADALLALFDWFRVYLGELAENPLAPPGNVDDLLTRLKQPEATHQSGSDDPDQSPADVAAAVCETDAAACDEVAGTSASDPLQIVVDDAMCDNLREFLCEAREHIQAAEESLLALEGEHDAEHVNTVFRAFHTIKGVAGFLNLGPIVDLAHNAEFLLDGARSGRITLSSGHLDLVLASCDMLLHLLGMLEGGPAVARGRFEQLNQYLKQTADGGEPPQDLRALSADRVEAPERSGAEPAAQDAGSSSAMSDERSKVSRKPRVEQTVKVSTTRLDNLVTMVGELVISQQMVIQDPAIQASVDSRLQRNLGMVWKIVRDLQEVSMSLRMVTLRGTFQKMTRLVRDVAAKAGKKINFHTEGEDVELDRNVVEEIADPLVHMIRNSCDHGIESAAERLAAGKSEAGNVTLRAFYSGGSIVIEIEDDGRGLNREKILKKAIDKGIYTPERDPAEIPDSEIFNLVFLPGFSTADQVTDISGRGVGMDVVRRNIEALRGKIDIRSTPGKGSTFVMHLPLTMAIIDGMVVRVGNQRYVVPTLSIEHSFRPKTSDIKSAIGKGEMAMVRGSTLPLYRLNRVLSLDEGAEDPAEALLLVLESANSRCALMVDEIIGQQQVVIKNLGQGFGSIRGISGGAILGDGRIAPILDIGGIVQEATAVAA